MSIEGLEMAGWDWDWFLGRWVAADGNGWDGRASFAAGLYVILVVGS